VRLITNVSHRWDSPGVVAGQQREIVAQARSRFDVVLLDTAPLLSTSDPIDVVSAADYVVLVGRPGQTDRDDARQVTEILERHRVAIAGVLLSAVDPGDKVASSYYYSYAAEGPPATTPETVAAPAYSAHAGEPVVAGKARRRPRRRDKRRDKQQASLAGAPADFPVSVGAGSPREP